MIYWKLNFYIKKIVIHDFHREDAKLRDVPYRIRNVTRGLELNFRINEVGYVCIAILKFIRLIFQPKIYWKTTFKSKDKKNIKYASYTIIKYYIQNVCNYHEMNIIKIVIIKTLYKLI